MSWLEPKTAAAPESLESLLTGLERHGLPRLLKMGGGWYCNVEMNVTAVGAEFKVASEFDHRTAVAAAAECRDRVQAVLRSLNR